MEYPVNTEIQNNQFSSVLTDGDTLNVSTFEPLPFTSVLSTCNIQPAIVKKKLLKLRTDKSCGLDGVHPLLLNRLADTMSHPSFTTLFLELVKSLKHGRMVWLQLFLRTKVKDHLQLTIEPSLSLPLSAKY